MKNWKWWQWTLAVFGGLVVIGMINNLTSPDGAADPAQVTEPQPVADPLDSLRKHSRDIDRAAQDGSTLIVEGRAGSIDLAALEVKRIGEWMQENPDVAPTALRVSFRTETIDRLGNKGFSGLFDATFSGADMKAAKFDNLAMDGVLGLAKTAQATSPVGLQEAAAWCQKPDNVAFTGAGFCAKVLDLAGG